MGKTVKREGPGEPGPSFICGRVAAADGRGRDPCGRVAAADGRGRDPCGRVAAADGRGRDFWRNLLIYNGPEPSSFSLKFREAFIKISLKSPKKWVVFTYLCGFGGGVGEGGGVNQTPPENFLEKKWAFCFRPLFCGGSQVAHTRSPVDFRFRVVLPHAGHDQRGRPRGTGPRAARLALAWMA